MSINKLILTTENCEDIEIDGKYATDIDDTEISLCIKGKEHDISIKPVIDMESNEIHICFMNEVVEQGYWSKRINKTDMK